MLRTRFFSPDEDLLLAGMTDEGAASGLQPWSMSIGVSLRSSEAPPSDVANPIHATCEALKDAGLEGAQLGIEKDSALLPYRIAD